jgi:hypothetical protein
VAPVTPTIACVLRSGGRYTAEWVHRLKRGIERHASEPHRFVCLSDIDVRGVEVLPLREGWQGWWSKIELFRPGLLTGPTLYLDLDVVVVGDVAPLLSACSSFTMVHERGKTDYFNSSAMAWSGDMGWVHEAFKADAARHMERFRRHPRIGDQAFISDLLVGEGRAPRTFRQILGYDAIVSYKRDRCANGPPPRAHHTTVPQRTFLLFIPRLTRGTLSFQPHTWSAHATPQPMPNGT